MKKILAFILCFALLTGAFSVGVMAEKNEDSWKEVLLNALYKADDSLIDLSEYNVPFDEVSDFLSYDIHYHYPEIDYYFDWINANESSYKPNTRFVGKIKLTYHYDKKTIEDMQKEVYETVRPALESVKENWSDLQKALYLHDWLCANFMYDTRLWSDKGSENYDMYGFLEDGMGVCQAYAFTYIYLLRQFDIESYFVFSNEDSHGWNVVKIDEKWYHIDVTHDDPVFDRYAQADFLGRAEHEHFMLSDEELVSCCELHSNWQCPMRDDITCESYEGNTYWDDVVTPFINVDGYWYYVDYDQGGLIRSKNFIKTERIAEIGVVFGEENNHHWMINDNLGFANYYTGLSEMNGHLFYSDSTTVYCYDTHFGRINKVFKLDDKDEERLFGFQIKNRTINYVLFDYIGNGGVFDHNTHTGMYKLDKHLIKTDWIVIKEPTLNEDGERIKRCFICGEIVEHQTMNALADEKLFGDCDGNGKVEVADLATIKLYLAGSVSEVYYYADMDKDGKVNTSDLALVKLKLAGV